MFTDPFLILAEDWSPPAAYTIHPHRGMETVTFVIEGELTHCDSAGHGGSIGANDAQWMTAGRGVLHEENAFPNTMAHSLQLWVNLPASEKMSEPRYQALLAHEMPCWSDAGVAVRVFSGTSNGISAVTLNHVPVTMLDVRLQPGSATDLDLAASFNAFLFVLEGSVHVGVSETLARSGELVWLTRPNVLGPSSIRLSSGYTSGRVLLFAGSPLKEPVVFGGPFVMSSEEEIKQAFRDFAAGHF